MTPPPGPNERERAGTGRWTCAESKSRGRKTAAHEGETEGINDDQAGKKRHAGVCQTGAYANSMLP
jgi:hypothetical protein